jgi:hypothetical protein
MPPNDSIGFLGAEKLLLQRAGVEMPAFRFRQHQLQFLHSPESDQQSGPVRERVIGNAFSRAGLIRFRRVPGALPVLQGKEVASGLQGMLAKAEADRGSPGGIGLLGDERLQQAEGLR